VAGAAAVCAVGDAAARGRENGRGASGRGPCREDGEKIRLDPGKINWVVERG
jgi:hypothetical protein